MALNAIFTCAAHKLAHSNCYGSWQKKRLATPVIDGNIISLKA